MESATARESARHDDTQHLDTQTASEKRQEKLRAQSAAVATRVQEDAGARATQCNQVLMGAQG